MTTHEVLVAARNRIATRGWCPAYGRPEGPHCAVAALHYTTDSARPALQVLAGLLGLGGADVRDLAVLIGDWNDYVAQSEQEVLAVFDEAIRQTAPAPDTSFLNDRIAKDEQNVLFFGPIFEEAKS